MKTGPSAGLFRAPRNRQPASGFIPCRPRRRRTPQRCRITSGDLTPQTEAVKMRCAYVGAGLSLALLLAGGAEGAEAAQKKKKKADTVAGKVVSVTKDAAKDLTVLTIQN